MGTKNCGTEDSPFVGEPEIAPEEKPVTRPSVSSVDIKPFAPDVFRMLANPDPARYKRPHCQHFHHTNVVMDWAMLRQRSIDMAENDRLFKSDGPPRSCDKCGEAFLPFACLQLRGDLDSPDLAQYDGAFTDAIVPTVCQGYGPKHPLAGEIVTVGNAVVLFDGDEIALRGVFCGTPWYHNPQFYDKETGETYPMTFKNRHGCLGTIRDEWGKIAAQLQLAQQVDYLLRKGRLGDQERSHLEAIAESAVVKMVTETINNEKVERPEEWPSWKERVRSELKRIEDYLNRNRNGWLQGKVFDLTELVKRPPMLACLSLDHVEKLIKTKTGRRQAAREERAKERADVRANAYAKVFAGRHSNRSGTKTRTVWDTSDKSKCDANLAE